MPPWAPAQQLQISSPKKTAATPTPSLRLNEMGACVSVGKESALIEARKQHDTDERDMRKQLRTHAVAAVSEHCKQKTIVMNGKEWCPDCRRELPTYCICRVQTSADKNKNTSSNCSRPVSPERGARLSPSDSRPVSPDRGVQQSRINSPERRAQQSPKISPGDFHLS